MYRFIYYLLILGSLLSSRLIAEAKVGQAERWNSDWLFQLGDNSENSSPALVDSTWRQLSLPHDWSVEQIPAPNLGSCQGYLPGGIGWYRKHFNIDTLPKGEKIKVYFEGIYNRSEIFLNGHKIGERPNGYISTEYDLTPYLQPGENVLAVRVDHSRQADSRWYTGSGIYRDVWLYRKPARSIALWGVSWTTPLISSKEATLDILTELEGTPQKNLTLRYELLDPQGKVCASRAIKANADSCRTSLKVKNPKLWSLDSPNLYKLQATLLERGKAIDSETVPVGFRTIRFDADSGFYLNGKNMKLKGVCLHHDAGVVGAAVPRLLVERRLKALKKIGVNAIRCSHNPQATDFYELCDSIGLLVMDEASDEWEFPKRKWLDGWNVGTPGFEGSYDFFEEWIERDVTDMTRRDRVHPSIILWSVGNEVDYPNDPYSHPVLDGDGSGFTQPIFGGYNPEAPNAERIGKIAKRLAGRIREADSSRPVTGALAGVVMSNETEYPEAVDVVGYNYTESRYDEDHQKYPGRVIYGSENRPDYQAWLAVRDKDFISGQFIWTGADYLGESRRWPSRGMGTGLIDFANNLKPRGRFREALWSDRPVAHLAMFPITQKGIEQNWLSFDAPKQWNFQEGEMIRVECFTNASEATLLLNDSVVGVTKPFDTETGIIYWDIPYREGTLKVITDNPEATDSVTTSKQPARMEARVIDRDKELVIVEVRLLDAEGTLCLAADPEVRCMVKGGELLGLENADNSDMTIPKAHSRRFHNGLLYAYVRPGAKGATVRFHTPLLKDISIEIQ